MRKVAKDHGTRGQVEGNLAGHKRVAILDDVNAELCQIPAGTTFWGLPNANHTTAPVNSILWRMWRAVDLLEAVPGVAEAVSHKTLHHKRPELFPLLDNKTMGSYLPRDSWQIIHADLTAFAPEFAALEEWFAGEAAQRGKVGLTRLRMHDIILWLHASIDSETNQSQWETAVTIGTNDFGF